MNCISFWFLVRCPSSKSEAQLLSMNDDALPAAVVLKWCLHGSRERSRSLDGDS